MSKENGEFLPHDPNSVNTEKKKAILENSSVLKTFLSDSSDFSAWIDLQVEVTKPMLEDFTEILGENWAFFSSNPLVSLGYVTQIFNDSYPDLKDHEKYFNLTTAELIFMGYEIGNDPVVADFVEDLTEKIESLPYINSELENGQDLTLKQYITASLTAGINIKHKFGGRLAKQLPEPRNSSAGDWDPGFFRHALDDVDMSGI